MIRVSVPILSRYKDGASRRFEDINRFESRPLSARTSVPEADTACTWLKSNKGTGGSRELPEENRARQSRRDQEPRRFKSRIQTKRLTHNQST